LTQQVRQHDSEAELLRSQVACFWQEVLQLAFLTEHFGGSPPQALSSEALLRYSKRVLDGALSEQWASEPRCEFTANQFDSPPQRCATATMPAHEHAWVTGKNIIQLPL